MRLVRFQFMAVRADVNWSGRRDSNPRPLPWQGSALSTELLPRQSVLMLSPTCFEVPNYSLRVGDVNGKYKAMSSVLRRSLTKWIIFICLGLLAFTFGYFLGERQADVQRTQDQSGNFALPDQRTI
jgi:hypothetical protein